MPTLATSPSLLFEQYLRFLQQLQRSIDSVNDDACMMDHIVLQGTLTRAPLAPQQGNRREAFFELIARASVRAALLETQLRHQQMWGGISSHHRRTHSSEDDPANNDPEGHNGTAGVDVSQRLGSLQGNDCASGSVRDGDAAPPQWRRLMTQMTQRSFHCTTAGCQKSPCAALRFFSGLAAEAQRRERRLDSSSVDQTLDVEEKNNSNSFSRKSSKGEQEEEASLSVEAEGCDLLTAQLSTVKASLTSSLDATGSGSQRARPRQRRSATNETTVESQTLPITAVAPVPPPQRGNGPAAGPTTVALLTQQRQLHPVFSQLSSDEVCNCMRCSAQIDLQSGWVAVFLLQQLTLLSGAVEMMAPLPPPPPSILYLQPTEVMVLLFQIAGRCFTTSLQLILAVVAKVPRIEPPPFLSSGLAGLLRQRPKGSTDGGGNTVDGDDVATVNAIISSSAMHFFSMAKSITSSVPYLMGHHPPPTASIGMLNNSSSDAGRLWKRSSILATRFSLLHVTMVLLLQPRGSVTATLLLKPLIGRLKREHPRCHSLSGSRCNADVDAGSDNDEVDRNTEKSQSEEGAISSAFDSIYETAALVLSSAVLGGRKEDGAGEEAILLLCVLSLLAVFTDLLTAREAADAEKTLSSSPLHLLQRRARLIGAAAHLMDNIVFVQLQQHQSSSQGGIVAQAHTLLALWWLIRSEMVRFIVATQGDARRIALQHCHLKAISDEPKQDHDDMLRVLGKVVVLRDSDAKGAAAEVDAELDWQLWLKEASRATVRVSDAAGEFCGLSLFADTPHQWSSTPPASFSAALPSAAIRLVLDSGAKEVSTGSDRPVEQQPQPGFVSMAPLPVSWLRLWLLLCPPLFRISLADVLMERQEASAEAATSQKTIAVTAPSPPQMPMKPPPATRKAVVQRQKKLPSTSTAIPMARSNGRGTGVEKAMAGPSGQRMLRRLPRLGASSSSSSLLPLPDLRRRDGYDPVLFWHRWRQLFLMKAVSKTAASEDDALHAIWRRKQSVMAAAADDTPPSLTLLYDALVQALCNPVSLLSRPVNGTTDSSLVAPSPLLTYLEPYKKVRFFPPLSSPSPSCFPQELHTAFPLMKTDEIKEQLDVSAAELCSGFNLQQNTTQPAPPTTTAAAGASSPLLFPSYSVASSIPQLRDGVVVYCATHHLSAEVAPALTSPDTSAATMGSSFAKQEEQKLSATM